VSRCLKKQVIGEMEEQENVCNKEHLLFPSFSSLSILYRKENTLERIAGSLREELLHSGCEKLQELCS